jgi:hypothetical protein
MLQGQIKHEQPAGKVNISNGPGTHDKECYKKSTYFKAQNTS